MKVGAFFLFIFLVVALQGTLFDGLSIKGIKPDFPFILSYGIGLYKGEIKGLLLGGFIGLLVDSSTGTILGPSLISKATVGFSSGYLRRKTFRVTPTVNLSSLFILSLLDGIINLLLINIFLGHFSFLNAFRNLILPQAAYSAIFGLPILMLAERLKINNVRE